MDKKRLLCYNKEKHKEKKITVDENRKCRKCENIENQIKVGYNSSGTQHCKYKDCNIRYTSEPKKHTYSKGVSGRGIGKILGMNKANVYNWIKKLRKNDIKTSYEYFELDELYCFIEKKPRTETRENIYIMTMVSRETRQIVGFDVALDKSPERIQNIIVQTDIMDTLILLILASIYAMFMIKVTPLPLRVSMLICVIIFLFSQEKADVFHAALRLSKLLLQFLLMHITDLV